MPAFDRSKLNKPEHWSKRAEQARADAEKTTDRKAKRLMLGFAEGYEKDG